MCKIEKEHHCSCVVDAQKSCYTVYIDARSWHLLISISERQGLFSLWDGRGVGVLPGTRLGLKSFVVTFSGQRKSTGKEEEKGVRNILDNWGARGHNWWKNKTKRKTKKQDQLSSRTMTGKKNAAFLSETIFITKPAHEVCFFSLKAFIQRKSMLSLHNRGNAIKT